MNANDFYEDDEPLNDVIAAFEAGEKGRTRPRLLTLEYRQTRHGWRATSPETPDIDFSGPTLTAVRQQVHAALDQLLDLPIPTQEIVHRLRQASAARPFVEISGPRSVPVELSTAPHDQTRASADLAGVSA